MTLYQVLLFPPVFSCSLLLPWMYFLLLVFCFLSFNNPLENSILSLGELPRKLLFCSPYIHLVSPWYYFKTDSPPTPPVVVSPIFILLVCHFPFSPFFFLLPRAVYIISDIPLGAYGLESTAPYTIQSLRFFLWST